MAAFGPVLIEEGFDLLGGIALAARFSLGALLKSGADGVAILRKPCVVGLPRDKLPDGPGDGLLGTGKGATVQLALDKLLGRVVERDVHA